MADDLARQSIQIALQMADKAGSISAAETNAIANLLQSFADYDKNASKLLKYQKEYGNLDYFVCDKKLEHTLTELLGKNEVVFSKMRNIHDSNMIFFVYPDCYKNRVNELRSEMLIRNGMVGVVSKDQLIRNYKGNGILSIDGLSMNQAKIIRDLLSRKNTTIAMDVSQSQGKYKIYFHEKDREQVSRAFLQQSILVSRKSEARLSYALSTDLTQKQNLMEKSRWLEEKEHHYILGEANEMMEVRYSGFAYLGKDTRYLIRNTDREYDEKLYATVSRMERPVLLTEQEYQKYRNLRPNEKKQMHEEKAGEIGYADYSHILAQEMKVLEQKTALMEKKIQMENPDRQMSEYDLFNDSMSFSAFESEEHRNAEFEQYKNLTDEKEIQQIQEDFQQYHIEEEEINFSQYQIMYEEHTVEDKVPIFLREQMEHDSIQDYRDQMADMDISYAE